MPVLNGVVGCFCAFSLLGAPPLIVRSFIPLLRVLHGKPSVSSSWAASVLAEQAPQRTIHDDSATTPQLPAAQMLLSTGCSELLCWRSLKPTGSSVLKALWAHAGSGAVHKQQVGKLPFTNEWQSEHFSEAANCSPCAG